MQNKWMTREEFEKENNDCYCWIQDCDYSPYMAYFYNGNYYEFDSTDAQAYNPDGIRAVMPIEKPEYPIEIRSDPKEVG